MKRNFKKITLFTTLLLFSSLNINIQPSYAGGLSFDPTNLAAKIGGIIKTTAESVTQIQTLKQQIDKIRDGVTQAKNIADKVGSISDDLRNTFNSLKSLPDDIQNQIKDLFSLDIGSGGSFSSLNSKNIFEDKGGISAFASVINSVDNYYKQNSKLYGAQNTNSKSELEREFNACNNAYPSINQPQAVNFIVNNYENARCKVSNLLAAQQSAQLLALQSQFDNQVTALKELQGKISSATKISDAQALNNSIALQSAKFNTLIQSLNARQQIMAQQRDKLKLQLVRYSGYLQSLRTDENYKNYVVNSSLQNLPGNPLSYSAIDYTPSNSGLDNVGDVFNSLKNLSDSVTRAKGSVERALKVFDGQ